MRILGCFSRVASCVVLRMDLECDADQSFESSVAAMASDRRSTQTSERSKSAVQVWTDEKSRHSSLRLMIDSWTGFLRDTLPVEPEQPFCHGLLG